MTSNQSAYAGKFDDALKREHDVLIQRKEREVRHRIWKAQGIIITEDNDDAKDKDGTDSSDQDGITTD